MRSPTRLGKPHWAWLMSGMPIPLSSRITGSNIAGQRCSWLTAWIFFCFSCSCHPADDAAHRGAFLGVSHFGDDGEIRERANGVDGREQLVEIAESFEDEEIDAALFESSGLLFENREYLVIAQIANLAHDAERSIEPAMRTSCLAASRASRAILTPR